MGKSGEKGEREKGKDGEGNHVHGLNASAARRGPSHTRWNNPTLTVVRESSSLAVLLDRDVVLPRVCEHARHFRRKHRLQQMGLPDMPLRVSYYEAGEKTLDLTIKIFASGIWI